MAVQLPYLASYKNVGLMFDKIASAKVPEAFSQPFLYQTLGLKGKGDRGLIPLLRTLGFIDASGKPTAEYAALKNRSLARIAVAKAIRRAYAPLFEANENAHLLKGEDLRGLVAQVAGTDDDMTGRIVGTLNALLRVADFTGTEEEAGTDESSEEEISSKAGAARGAGGVIDVPGTVALGRTSAGGPLRPEFHYNIQVHLPSNATEEVYLSIFNALRKAFQ
jgi:hypothetical protein